MLNLEINLLFYTAILLVGHLAIPLGASTSGPAYVDLTYVLNTSIQNVSNFQVFISMGQIIGTLLGLIFKFVNRQLIIVLVIFGCAITTVLMPLTMHLWQLFSLAVIFGIGVGVWFVSFYMWIMEIWQHRSGPVLFLAQLMLGVGFTIGPLIDKPYLTGDLTSGATDDNHDKNNALIDVNERRSKLFVPFLISGCITAICPLLLLIMYFVKPYVKPKPEVTNENNVEIKHISHENNRIYKKSLIKKGILIILMTVCISTLNTLELIYFVFGATYFQYIPIRLTAPTAAGMVSAMIICYTSGQAINFFIGMCVKTNYIVCYHYVISFVAFIALIFANYSETALWATSAVIGLGVSALFPGHMTYFERHLKITDKISSFLWCTCSIVNFIPIPIFGYYIERFPIIFIVIELSLLTIALISVLLFKKLK